MKQPDYEGCLVSVTFGHVEICASSQMSSAKFLHCDVIITVSVEIIHNPWWRALLSGATFRVCRGTPGYTVLVGYS